MWHLKKNSRAPMSVIDQECEFEGRLNFAGTLVLNGSFHGQLVSSDTLLVGETGRLKADVYVRTAVISGHVSGHINAKERVELKRTARIFGDITTPVLILDEGVIFDGNCKMSGAEAMIAETESGPDASKSRDEALHLVNRSP